MDNNELFQWGIGKIMDAIKSRFYGSITFKFENGRIVSTKTEQMEKPPCDIK